MARPKSVDPPAGSVAVVLRIQLFKAIEAAADIHAGQISPGSVAASRHLDAWSLRAIIEGNLLEAEFVFRTAGIAPEKIIEK